MNSNSMSMGGMERRRYKRYRLKNETFAFFGTHMGTLVDISQGGLAVQCAIVEQDPVFPAQVDVFVATPTFHHLPDLPFFLVGTTQAAPVSAYDRLMTKRFSLQFGPLTRNQLARLVHFIDGNGVGGN